MAQNFSISNKGSTPRIGVSSPSVLQSAGLTSKPFISPSSSNAGAITQGTNTGMFPKDTTMKGVSTPPVVSVGGKSQVMKGSPSVLAQQQALNKLGAGLVEDGIAGELTKAAIASGKYNGTTGTTGTTSGVIPPPTPTPTPSPTTYPGLVEKSVAQSETSSPEYEKQQAEANRINQQIEDAKKQMAQQTSDINQSGTWTSRALGEQGQANIQNSATLAALGSQYQGATNQISQANTAQQLKQSALGTAIGAKAPIQVPYSNQVIDPTTGQPIGGGTSGNLQDTVKSVVQKLNSGQMTYNDALNALSGYGQGGVNELQKQLPPGFNIAQSNTLSGQQGTVKINYELADKALSNVETLMKDLPAIQNTNIPGVNALTQGFSTVTGIGSEQTRAVTGAVQSLRNAYASLLASARGGTPTDYSGQAQAEIPDKPTPNDIAAIRKNFETLGKVRTDILGNPGTSGGTSGSTTGGSIWNF